MKADQIENTKTEGKLGSRNSKDYMNMSVYDIYTSALNHQQNIKLSGLIQEQNQHLQFIRVLSKIQIYRNIEIKRKRNNCT